MALYQHKTKLLKSQTILAFLLALIIPPVMMIAMLAPFEPMHVFIQELLEIDLSPCEPGHWIIITIMIWVMAGGAMIFYTFGVTGVAYVYLAEACLESLVPTGSLNNGFEFGQGFMADRDYCMELRIEQLINLLLNRIYASVLVAFHHVVVLVIAIGCIVVVVVAGNQMVDAGIECVVILVLGTTIPFFIEYCESVYVGRIANFSSNISKKCQILRYGHRQKSEFYKVIVSLPTFRIKTAYPFFHVGDDTMFEFALQCLNYTVSILVCL